jgi:Bacterial alpha-L-rhamnosidase 6 hairpin glycosidase domain/Bacterial alpha-L-rhamnosidase C-terminal domain
MSDEPGTKERTEVRDRPGDYPLAGRRRRKLGAIVGTTTVAAVGCLLAASLAAQPAAASGGPSTAEAPTHLAVGGVATPLDVTGTPQFGWLPQDRAGDEAQTAYEISVWNGLTGARVWDSGRVHSSASSYVPYGGPALADGGEYDWSVVTWNRQNQASPAASSTFDMGLSDSDWSGAQWIRRPTSGNDSTIDYTLARKQFTLGSTGSKVVRALVYIAAPMRWQLHVNGTTVDTQDDYQFAGENYYDAVNITPQAQAAQHAPGSAAGQLAIGVLYAHWAAGEAHPAGPQPYASTLAAAAPAASSTITVATSSSSSCTSGPATSSSFCGASYDWYAGETLGFGTAGSAGFFTDTIASISGNTVTLASPLTAAVAQGTPVTSENGPSGMLVKVVVNYANGSSNTFVSDGSWMVTKDTAELNTTARQRSGQGAGDYVEYDSAQNAQSLNGWDRVGYSYTSAWQPATVMGTAPLPNPPDCGNYYSGASPCGFTNLIPLQAPLTYKLVHPVSVTSLPDGTVEADFGTAFVGVPVVEFPDSGAAEAGNRVTLTTSYRLAGTTLAAAAPAGATAVSLTDSSAYPDFPGSGSSTGFAVGDQITVDAPADGYGAGDPETDTITSIGPASDGQATVGLASPLRKGHASGVWVQGSRVGTDNLDTQDTNLNFYYTEDGTAGETTDFYVPMGWRYLQIYQGTQANGGQPLKAADIWAVEQYNGASAVGSGASDPGTTDYGPDTAANVPAYQDSATNWNAASVFTDRPASTVDEAATFHSSNAELNSVFTLLERSALYAGQQGYEDSPDRQEGQFTGDGTDESLSQIEDLSESALTREFIDNLIYSQQRWWIAGSPAQTSTWGEINAIYPDNDGKRDIPDYTEMFPELVWDYYLQTGDLATLAAAFSTMQNVATYVSDNIYSSGQAAGLVCQLDSYSSSSAYRYGIIDWPSTDRYDTVVDNSGVDTVINMRAVEDDRALAGAAQVLGHTAEATSYAKQMDSLIATINSKLVESTGFYDDGMTVGSPASPGQSSCTATTGDALIGNYSEHDQTFAVVYGVAPPSSYQQLGTYIASQGMKQGPMDLWQLELALVETNQPAALVSLLTNTTADGPAKILAEGGTSMWEQWDPGCSAPGGGVGDNTSSCVGTGISQNSTDSFSHGWGSAGLFPITRGLLGITVTGVAAATVQIAPPASGLTAASGTEWTERGPVTVSWRDLSRTAVGQDVLRVSVPDNVEATVSLPAGSVPYVAAGDGAPRYEGTSKGRAVYLVGSGVTTFRPDK